MNLVLVPEGGGQFPTGIAIWQDPPAGAQVKAGAGITVKFEAPLPLTNGP
jgi:beta-lactam-binding protein with PASTA domain